MKKIFLLCIALMSILPISAQQLSEGQIKQKINQVAASLKTMQCDFVQTKHLKMLNDKLVSQGKMYYKQSNQLRWEYTKPYSYTFILNNEKVMLKNSKRNDVIDVKQNKLFKEITRIMMNSVLGNSLNDDKSFTSSIVTENNEWVATLIPLRKDMKQMFQKIKLHFNPRNAAVTQVELIEKNGDKTIIELKNLRTNETLSAALFNIQ